jgi:hypothetical protein
MQKLEAVEEARTLMLEAKNWSVWKWLTEKRRVREAADRANEALDKLARSVRKSWSEELQQAYREWEAADPVGEHHRHTRNPDHEVKVSAEVRAHAKKLKQADDAAYEARMRAEQTFVDAEARLSASLAREGTVQAIESWDLKEKAIRKAEAAARAHPE